MGGGSIPGEAVAGLHFLETALPGDHIILIILGQDRTNSIGFGSILTIVAIVFILILALILLHLAA